MFREDFHWPSEAHYDALADRAHEYPPDDNEPGIYDEYWEPWCFGQHSSCIVVDFDRGMVGRGP